jgi:hypothetical protein
MRFAPLVADNRNTATSNRFVDQQFCLPLGFIKICMVAT